MVRRESRIYYEDQKTILDLPQDFALNGANVVYTGEVAARETGDFHFLLYYAGYVKVYIDGELLVPERWRTAWNPNSYKFKTGLKAGERVPIRIEWRPDGGVSYLGLRALTPVDPAEQNRLSWYSEMSDAIDYYYIAGDDADDVIAGYRRLTGKAQVMPRWAMGFGKAGNVIRRRKRCLPRFGNFGSVVYRSIISFSIGVIGPKMHGEAMNLMQPVFPIRKVWSILFMRNMPE